MAASLRSVSRPATTHTGRPDVLPATSVSGAIAQFAVAGLVVLALFLGGSLLVVRELGRTEGIRDARQFAVLAGQNIVEPAVRDSLLSGDRAALESLDRLVQERVLGERVVRVKIWTLGGRIVYSDEARLIGSVDPLDKAERSALQTGNTRAELSSLEGPENRFERSYGELYEVYLPIRTPSGAPLLFETYQRADEVTSTGRRIWLPFAGLLLGCLVLLWLVQVPLAYRLARRLRRSQHEREAMLIRTVEASTDERRRIAADLHDGVVQDLAGISYTLSAAAERADGVSPGEMRDTLRATAADTREAMRRLRSLIVDIHPPNLRASGLEAAIGDLLAPLAAEGLETSLDGAVPLPDDVELLFYRGAAEALRNVRRHARATRVTVRVSRNGNAVRLEVVDDGVGFTTAQREEQRLEGHVGLSLLEELAVRAGGRLEIASRPGAGTSFALEVRGT